MSKDELVHLLENCNWRHGSEELVRCVRDGNGIGRSILKVYQATFCKPLNKFLRMQEQGSPDVRLAHLLAHHLSEYLKSFNQFNKEVVFHAPKPLKPEWLSPEKVGKIIQVPGFMSTSKVEKNNGDRYPKFQIQTSSDSNGYDISSFNEESTELEVLFLPQTKLKILSIRKDIIHAEETDLPPDIIVYQNTHYYEWSSPDDRKFLI